MNKNTLTLIVFLLAVNVSGSQADERQIVKVGGYHFPPFVEDINGQKNTGLSSFLLHPRGVLIISMLENTT